MKIIITLLIGFFCFTLSPAQTVTLLTEDFESANLGSAGSWTQGYYGIYSTYPYNWFAVQNGGYTITNQTMEIINVVSGSSALYGYGIQNASNTSFAPFIYKFIDATGYTNIKVTYDWICNGEYNNDYGYLMVYPTSYGWLRLGDQLVSSTSVQHVSNQDITYYTNNHGFYLGWYFSSNQSIVNQPGLSLDNIVVTGEPILTSISTNAVASNSYCPGDNLSVSFTTTGNASDGNIFTAQLSDETGNFTSPTSIGALLSNVGGTISCTIPSETLNGSGYRIRVVSGYPVVTGNDNGSDIAIGITPNVWTQKANFGGGARTGAVSFSIGTKGYMGTGNIIGSTYFKDFWEYDPITNVWTQKADFGGTARYGAGSFVIGGKAYVGGGDDGDPYFKDDFWEYNPLTNSWVSKASMPSGRIDQVGFSIGSKGYYATGYTNTYSNELIEYDPALDIWTFKTAFPGQGRFSAVGFSIGTKGYVGTGAQNGSFFNDFWEYNPLTDSWTLKANFGGSARVYAAGFSIGNRGYIGGGSETGGFSAGLNDFWEYNNATNQWVQKASIGGTGKRVPAAFSLNGKGYLGTGMDGSTYLNDFWEYAPDNSITTNPISPTNYCAGASINVSFDAFGTYNTCFNTTFTAQLSDANGNFTSPTSIGTLISNTSGTISCTIPNETPNGTGYKIRVVSSNPTITGMDNGSNISIGIVDDGNICTTDGCDPLTGIFHNLINTNDNDACTTDGCDPSLGVYHTPVNIDDGNACTNDGCNSSTGVFHTTLNCDDNNVCTIDGCDPASSCYHTPISLDDNNVCTTDGCDPVTGPWHAAISCNDENVCTTDGCDPVTRCYHTPISVNDNNVCTTDGCDPVTGSYHTPVTVDDGNACTIDGCNSATGVFHNPVNIDDGNFCTADACDPATGQITHTQIPNCCFTPHTVYAGDDQNVCLGATINLGGVIGGSATSATWSGGAGFFSPDANSLNAIYHPTAAEYYAGILTLTLCTNNNGNGCETACDNVTLTFISAPAEPGPISGAGEFCVPPSEITFTIATVPGATSYHWTVPIGLTILSGQGSTSLHVSWNNNNLFTIEGDVCVVANNQNGCGGSAPSCASIAIHPYPFMVSGQTTVCAGQTVTYTTSEDALDYQWTISPPGAGIINGSSTDSIVSVTWGTVSSATLALNYSNACNPTNFNITINNCALKLNLKVFIEGFYLHADSMIAVVDPLNHPTLCDTITVQLVDSVDLNTIAASATDTISTHGYGTFTFDASTLLPTHKYYIAIRHRNTIETWSKYSMFFNTPIVSFDFTRP